MALYQLAFLLSLIDVAAGGRKQVEVQGKKDEDCCERMLLNATEVKVALWNEY